MFDIDTLLRQHRVGIAIRNVGPGVARIRSIRYFLDRKAVEDADSVLEQAKLDPDRDSGVSMDRGDSMAPGEIERELRQRQLTPADTGALRDRGPFVYCPQPTERECGLINSLHRAQPFSRALTRLRNSK